MVKAQINAEITNSVIALFLQRLGLRSDLLSLRAWELAIAKRMAERKVESPSLYYLELFNQPEEFAALTELVVVSETWFFRDAAGIKFVADLIVTSSRKKTRVLDVACSSGEEVYSLVMSLEELLVESSRYSIDAIDINGQAINKAKNGIYKKNSFREKKNHWKGLFFQKVDDAYVLKPIIKKNIAFFVENVFDDHFMQHHEEYDIILCRNLLAYLSKDHQVLLLKRFAKMLSPEGVLVVGPTEGEIAHRHEWRLVSPPQGCAFIPANSTGGRDE